MNEAIEDTGLRSHVTSLLQRYPNLATIETNDLVDFLKSGPAIDRGMLKGDPALAPIIKRVQSDHPAIFRISVGKQLGISLAIVLPFVLICWLIWDAGAN